MKYDFGQKVVLKDDAGKFVGKPLIVTDFFTSKRTGKELYEVTDDTENVSVCKEEDVVSAGEHLREILDAELIDEDEANGKG